MKREKYIPVFFTDDKWANIERLGKMLFLKHGINYKSKITSAGCSLYVAENKYLDALRIGTFIADNNNFKMNWVDTNLNKQRLGYFPIMKFVIPDNLLNNNSFKLSLFMDNYINSLENTLNFNFKYKINSDSVCVYSTNSLDCHDILISKLEKFNNIENFPLKIIEYLPIDSRFNNLRSFFDKSLVMTSLTKPNNINILKKYKKRNRSGSKFLLYSSTNGINFIRTKIRNDSTLNNLSIDGEFSVFENKIYKNFEFGTMYIPSNDCNTTDLGTIHSNLFIDNDGVEITTMISNNRNIDGHNYDGLNIRDGIFRRGLKTENKNVSIIKEFYKVIDNSNRLLHYTSTCNYFEIYDLPSNWSIKDGLNNLGLPKVFNNEIFDLEDKSLDEVNKVMNNKGKVKSKRIKRDLVCVK